MAGVSMIAVIGLITRVLPHTIGSRGVLDHTVSTLCTREGDDIGTCLQLSLRNWAVVVVRIDVRSTLTIVGLHAVYQGVGTLQVEPALLLTAELESTLFENCIDGNSTLQ